MRTVKLLAACLIVAGATSAPARADVAAAARAFADGQSAQLEGNLERAAQSFELAYSIQPSKEALRSAARVRMQAGQLARAATHAEALLASFGRDPASVKLAESILEKARPRLGRVELTCDAPCTVALDGRALVTNPAERHVFFVNPGKQQLEAGFASGRSVTRDVAPLAGEKLEVRVAAPAAPVVAPPPVLPLPDAPAPDERRARRGLPRWVTFTGIGVTAALGGLTLWSGLDTVSAHDDYVANPTQEGWDDGRSKQLRTNLLLGATVVAGVGTALVAILWTDWRAERPRLSVLPSRDGFAVGVAGEF